MCEFLCVEAINKYEAMFDLVSRHDVQMTVIGAESQVAVDCRAFNNGHIFILITLSIIMKRNLHVQQQQQQ